MTPDDQSLAAELALGLLDHEDAAAAERRRRDGGAFAAEVTWWETAMAEGSLTNDRAPPPPGALTRIETSLFGVAEPDRPARTASAFPWRTFILGLVAVKLTLVALWALLR